jgi:hypothetical protein
VSTATATRTVSASAAAYERLVDAANAIATERLGRGAAVEIVPLAGGGYAARAWEPKGLRCVTGPAKASKRDAVRALRDLLPTGELR